MDPNLLTLIIACIIIALIALAINHVDCSPDD